MLSPYPKLLKSTLLFIAAVQVILGIALILFPQQFIATMGLPPTPEWAYWLFGQMGARAIGFALGLIYAVQNLHLARMWIWAMIVVQAIDWLVTVKYLLSGAMLLNQVSTAPYFPLLFIVALVIAMPRKHIAGAI